MCRKSIEDMSAGDYLRLHRERKNLSLRQLEKITGVPFSTISRMEQNNDTLFSSVVLVANALGISLDTIADLGK